MKGLEKTIEHRKALTREGTNGKLTPQLGRFTGCSGVLVKKCFDFVSLARGSDGGPIVEWQMVSLFLVFDGWF